MTIDKINGPYFPGQKPWTCGHYYPDVVVLKDGVQVGGKVTRNFDCMHCGEYSEEVDVTTPIRTELSRDQLDTYRIRERARLSAM